MWKSRQMSMPKEKHSCPYCQRMISYTQMNRHKETCKERIHKAPLNEITYGEAKDSGRIKEWLNQ